MHSGASMSLAASVAESVASGGGGSYDGKIAGLYDLEETLGSGHFAVVKLARHVFTGAKVAVKVVDKTKLDDVSKAHLFQEVRCMKLVQHPNVVRLYEVIDTQTKLYLVLELGDGGDLYDYIMKHEGGLSENLARKYFRQILRAITYCHQLHVVHRDLKPENVVFFEKLGVVKLTDFGFSNKFSPGQKLETFCGSLAYSAPEILLGDSYDAPAVDIWSLGVILYMLVCGTPPFEKANDSETLTMIMDCKYTMPPQVTPTCRELIGSMLVRDPKKRASLEQIAADPWLKDSTDVDTSDYLPLVSRQELSEEDHAFIIQKMINGNIASKEDILQALDKNTYNHITATYFLLAEIRLRKHREEAQKQHALLSGNLTLTSGRGSDNQVKPSEGNKLLAPVSIKVCPPTSYTSEAKTDKRSRKCSIVREEDEDESPYESVVDANEIRVSLLPRESISDGRLNRSVLERSNPAAQVPMVISVDGMVSNTNAVIVNVMDEDSVESVRPLAMQDTLRGLKDLEIGKLKPLPMSPGIKNPVLTHRRTKINKIRTPSCSSSEASDDDTKARSKKKINKFVGDTPTRFRMHRRDSHDDSSDSQDQAFSSSGSHSQAANVIASNNSNVSEKKNKQTQGKEQNKSEETRKSSNSHSKNNKKQPKDNVAKYSQSYRQSHSAINDGRRRVSESQSLDRITEAQEYELRHRCFAVDPHSDHMHSLFNVKSFSVVETKEEDEDIHKDSDQTKNTINEAEASLQLKCSKLDFYKLNSIDEIDLILEDKSLTKEIQVTGSKCFVTMKKIRRLGKYFPVVNFS